MNRQEAVSIVVCFIMVLLLLAHLLIWLAAAPAGAAGGGSLETNRGELEPRMADEKQQDVVVDLPKDTAEATPAASPEGTGEDASLATRQQGSTESQSESPHEEPKAKPPASATADTPVSKVATVETASSIQETPNTQSLEPSEEAKPDIPPASLPTGDSGEGEETQRTLEGNIPPLTYAGRTDVLFRLYPRLEMVWVRDRDPREGRPEVILEFIRDQDGGLQWRNIQDPTGSSLGFAFATRSHATGDCVHVNDPATLKIWERRAEICEKAGLADPQSRLLCWGYYRHRVEQHLLQPALVAFRRAQQKKELDFQPQQRTSLEIVWDVADDSQPYVAAARFLADRKPPVELTVERPPGRGD